MSYTCKAVHMPKKNLKKALFSYLWLTFRLCVSRKQRLRKNCKLRAGVLKTCLPPLTHTEPLSKG